MVLKQQYYYNNNNKCHDLKLKLSVLNYCAPYGMLSHPFPHLATTAEKTTRILCVPCTELTIRRPTFSLDSVKKL